MDSEQVRWVSASEPELPRSLLKVSKTNFKGIILRSISIKVS